MRQIEYRFFDADNHDSEPRDCLARFIEPQHREHAA